MTALVRVPLAILRVARAMRHGLAIMARVMNACAGWTYIIAAFFVTGDVVSRHVFGFSSGSTTEVVGYVLACGIAWGLGQAMLERAHIRIDILVMRIPLRIRQYLHATALILLIVFIGFLASAAYDLTAESMLFGSTDLSALATPLAVPQGIWTFGLCSFELLLLVMLAEVLALLWLGDAAAIDALLAHHVVEIEGETADHHPVFEGRGAS